MSGTMPAATPIVLHERYELGGLIAEGGMAQVFHGRDRLLDRDVAIKILRAQYAASPDFLDRFRREARMAASLPHPHLVNVYDVGEDAGRHYIVMELLPGRTVKELVARGPLPLETAIELARQVALGMALAHRRGLVHRDLKPQNILLTEDGQAKVADFGIAQAAETAHLTVPGTVWGTVHYIAPEQAQGVRPDARSDIYSLGAMFFELLTGRPPYDGATPAAIMMKHVYDPVPQARAINPVLPAAIEGVLRQAMAKAPAERFQSMDEFAQTLVGVRVAAAAETMAWAPVGPSGPASRSSPVTAAPGTTGGSRTATAGQRWPAPSGDQTAAFPVRSAGARGGPSYELLPPRAVAGLAPAAGADVVPARRARRRVPAWVPILLAASVLAFFGLMAVGAFVAREVAIPGGQQTRVTATTTPERATPTVAPTAVPLVPVPGVVGDPVAKAHEKLTAAGLTVEVFEDFSRDVPTGNIASQDPAANAQLEQGKPVKLVVSKGPQKATIPSVLGSNDDEAVDKLTKAGFTVVKMEEFSRQWAAGTVFEQSPRGGEANVGSEVTIKVSKGRDQVVVPAVLSMPEAAARERLAKEGLKIEVVYEPYAGVEPGQVFTQEPIANEKVDRDTTVRIKVRRDPTPAPPTATAVPSTPTPAPTSVPTRAPAAQPTAPPTAAATAAPTTAPTAAPATAATAAATRPPGTPTR
ncbi:MAG: Stk1 family PASTA domain-containing Ser/Thr kinase [Chloroflexi bacterium]|nr:Stk1 family PASTA domain-containing Ser/Thr kinase [Chloroflexota bacterium]